METLKYEKILVPVDGSNNSLKAVSHASYLASRLECEIGLLHVMVMPQDIYLYGHPGHPYIPSTANESIESMREKAGEVILKAKKLLPEGIVIKDFIVEGSPGETIAKFAQDNNFDLIIMGSRGLGLIKGVLMGSVSSYVIHNAKCSSMIIK
mgnify:CR=1 FL=1